MIEQLANADLSAPKPGSAARRTEYGSGDPSLEVEEYPGTRRQVRRRAAEKGVSSTGEGYELNFDQADLAALAKVILKDTLDLAYVFDPQVQGRVTVSTGGPISRNELLSLLEAVLDMNGAALVADGSFMRIVPKAEGLRSGAVRIDYAEESGRIGAGYGISVVPLRYVSSETMMRMLASFGSSQETLRASVENNLLLIRGPAEQRAALVDVAAMFDVDWMKGQSAGIYTLQHASPEEIITELQQVFRTEGKGKGLLRFQPVRRLNAILALTDEPRILDEVGEWIARLDREGTLGESYFVYRVENAKAKDLAELLSATFGGGGGLLRTAEETSISPTEAAVSVGTTNDLSTTQGLTTGSTNTRSTTGDASGVGRFASASLAGSSVPTGGGSLAGSGEIRIVPDEINNRLLIRAPGRLYRKILQVLHRIDQPPVQVLINATLAEVTLTDDLRYGVQFYFDKKGRADLLGFTNGRLTNILPSAPGLNFILGLNSPTPRIILDALAAETAVRIVSSPSVVVLHNQTASLQVGEEIPIATRSAVSVVNTDAPVVNEITFRDTGVILKVTPRINSTGLVTMDIVQEISAVINQVPAGEPGSLTPTISQRRIASTIAVQDGQLVVLGGLIAEQAEHEKGRVPGINKIPYLGDVVGDTTRGKTRKELIVFLQPKVIYKPVDASNVAQELRARMESLAPTRAPIDENAAWGTTTKTFK